MVPGPLMLDLETTALTADEQDLLRHPQVGGVIFFSRNFRCREQIIELTAAIAQLRPDILLAVDQEGGRVQRLRDGFTRLPAMQVLGDFFARDPVKGSPLIVDIGWLMASELIASGIDFSFAPVLDVDRAYCEVIGDRSFGDDPERIVNVAELFINGMREAGMAATGKHFPGHGGVRGDSHLETPCDDRSLEQLRARDLIPFAKLAPSLGGVMPAHMIFPQVDSRAVGFSPLWLQQILRGELDFNGVVFSDDLSMKGADVAGGYAAKTAAALAAGCDMVLVCNNRGGALEVLDYLEKNPVQGSTRLASMKARAQYSWDDLADHPRRLATVEQLRHLV